MIVVITLGYLACVFLAFKVIKIKATPPAIAVAATIGAFLLGSIVVVWKLAAPMSGQMVLRRHVLAIVPDVREVVSQVHVQRDKFVKKGEPLFDILPDRFQNAVDEGTAQLAAAKSTVSQLEAAVTAAEAGVKKSESDTATQKAIIDSASHLKELNPEAVATLEVEKAEQAYRAAEAAEKVVRATLHQTQFSLAAARHSVDVAQASLKIAEFNLNQCTYRSPFDGQIVNLQITEGTSAARWRFTSIGTVMDLSDTAVIAVFPQNLLVNVSPGNDVEIAFKRRPGQITTGEVEAVVNYTGEGQVLPTETIPSAASIGSKGFLFVRIRIDDRELERKLPLGAAGSVAIYTDFGKPFHLISKITVRMKAWMHYLPF